MASIPKRLKIGHLSIVLRKRKACDFDGLADFERSTLTIRSGLARDRERQVLVHECLHFLCDNAGIEMSEEHTDALASGLLCLLRDNESVVNYLCEKEKGKRDAK